MCFSHVLKVRIEVFELTICDWVTDGKILWQWWVGGPPQVCDRVWQIFSRLPSWWYLIMHPVAWLQSASPWQDLLQKGSSETDESCSRSEDLPLAKLEITSIGTTISVVNNMFVAALRNRVIEVWDLTFFMPYCCLDWRWTTEPYLELQSYKWDQDGRAEKLWGGDWMGSCWEQNASHTLQRNGSVRITLPVCGHPRTYSTWHVTGWESANHHNIPPHWHSTVFDTSYPPRWLKCMHLAHAGCTLQKNAY